VHAVGDLRAFTAFLRLAAGRTAQELNLSTLGADAGVSYNTIRTWISVLEATWLCFVAPAWHRNTRKRWVKAPKLHWFDSGLVCHLLGITDVRQLAAHPLRGAIFESWVAAEIWKAHAHRGQTPNLVHFRATRGAEVDLGVLRGRRAVLVEAKSGATLGEDAFGALRRVRGDLLAGKDFDAVQSAVVYGGEVAQRREEAVAVPWSALADRDWTR